ncbi:MAG: hypothetical protein JXB35_10395 [Anaerolineae bacterium]|nr:hypothetical protein [Anaerolineae bacterium]
MRRLVVVLVILLILSACRAREVESLYLPLVTSVRIEKAGIGSDVALQQCGDTAYFHAVWWYNWSPHALTSAHEECGEFIPMLFSVGDKYHVPDDADKLLVLNECDWWQQCNMTPQAAAEFMHWIVERYPQYDLIGPAATDRESGWEWIQEFGRIYRRMCGEWPPVEAVAVHCYLGTAEACIQHTERYIDLARDWGADGVWVTEWQMPSIAEAQEVRSWLDNEPEVLRWAYFAARSSWGDTSKHLISPQGYETTFGTWFSESGLP